MITKPVLRSLIKRYLRDAEVLSARRRYPSAIYLAGYAVELALKLKICRVMMLRKGFPESKVEFQDYFAGSTRAAIHGVIRKLRDIRNHDLEKLLIFSGEEFFISTELSEEWNQIRVWNPAMRYRLRTIRKERCKIFLQACVRIINKII